jgi:hypothetical protein
MRTSAEITTAEKNAYNAFCTANRIVNDQTPVAIQNGKHIGDYIIKTWGEDIDTRTLGVALEQLRDRLVFISAEQIEVTEILSHLDQSQRDIVASWVSKQHRLETEGPKGFSNVSVLCAYLINRRRPISEEGLTMALGNAQNSGHRKIFWKESPKESREYVHGKKNFAFGQDAKPKPAAAGVQQQEFHPNGRRNHSYVSPEEAQKKVAAQAPDSWQEIIDLHMREWVTPSQQSRLENELSAGLAAGRSKRDIAMSLGALVKDQRRGR